MLNFCHKINNNISINHPSVLKFIGYSPTNFENESKPVAVTEFAQNGSLSNIINLERHSLLIEGWNDTKKLITIYGIASAMTYLRANKVLNYDLNPQNILMDSMLLPKISNYELFQKMLKNSESKSIESIYIAPEIFESEASNVYSFGLIVYVILTAKIPFENLNSSEIYQKVVLEHYRPSFDAKINEAYRNLIERCWSQEPEKRPSFAEITDELEKNEEFITESVDKDDFISYVEFVKQYMNGSDEKEVIKLDNFIRNIIPSSVTSIETQAFENCSSLEIVIIPFSVTSIGERAFKECSSLKQISIPSFVTKIPNRIFDGCASLEKVKIQSFATSIGFKAFNGCVSLKQISIPSSVREIGLNSFPNNTKVTKI